MRTNKKSAECEAPGDSRTYNSRLQRGWDNIQIRFGGFMGWARIQCDPNPQKKHGLAVLLEGDGDTLHTNLTLILRMSRD